MCSKMSERDRQTNDSRPHSRPHSRPILDPFSTHSRPILDRIIGVTTPIKSTLTPKQSSTVSTQFLSINLIINLIIDLIIDFIINQNLTSNTTLIIEATTAPIIETTIALFLYRNNNCYPVTYYASEYSPINDWII